MKGAHLAARGGTLSSVAVLINNIHAAGGKE